MKATVRSHSCFIRDIVHSAKAGIALRCVESMLRLNPVPLLKRGPLLRALVVIEVLFVATFSVLRTPPAQAAEPWLQEIWWGERQTELIAHLGARAMVLQRPIDFGDSYTQIVLRQVVLGVPLIAFFQIDTITGGLKRIQLERQRHGVNPPAFRAVVGALEAEHGAPDKMCSIPPGAGSGYQAAAEVVWWRGGNLIRAVFRDTTMEPLEGCLSGDLTSGPCGLTGQLFVRISPPGADATTCLAPR